MMETDEILLIPKGRTKDAMNHLWPNRGAGRGAEHLPHNLKSIPLARAACPPAVIRRPPARPLPLNQSRLIPAITLLIIACYACLAPAAAAREGAGGSEPFDPV